MNNKAKVSNPKYQRLRIATLVLFLFAVLSVVMLFTFRSLDTRNYNGQVREVSGTVISIDEKDDTVVITLDDNTKYNGNRINACYPDFDLDSLLNKQVTLVLPESQVGADSSTPRWVLGIMRGDETLIDYNKVIADGKAEAKTGITVCTIIAVVFMVGIIGLILLRLKVAPHKEDSFYKVYGEFAALRQPSCPEYKRLPGVILLYVAVILLTTIPLSIIGSVTENVTVQIAVGFSACAVFLGFSAGLIVYSIKLANKERKFYAENFPFNLDDISHLPAFGKQKRQKAEMQQKIREEREQFPHRYFDAGNEYTVDFTADGVEFFDEMQGVLEPDAGYVFGDSETNASRVYKLTYQQLNFEALPYYRGKDHPLTVIIKSRIEDSSALPEEMTNDLHILLDSNLLATMQHFGVEVENLQFILDNKAQLIKENCTTLKKGK